MISEQKERLIKMFIDGKSYEDLGYYFEEIEFDGNQEEVLKEIYKEHQVERERVAIRDLKRAMGLLLGFVVFLFYWIFDEFYGNYWLVIASGFMWISSKSGRWIEKEIDTTYKVSYMLRFSNFDPIALENVQYSR